MDVEKNDRRFDGLILRRNMRGETLLAVVEVKFGM